MPNPFERNPLAAELAEPGDSTARAAQAPAMQQPNPLSPEGIAARAGSAAAAADALVPTTNAFRQSQVEAAKKKAAAADTRLAAVRGDTNAFAEALRLNEEQAAAARRDMAGIVERKEKVARMSGLIREFVQMFRPSLSPEEIRVDEEAVAARQQLISDDAVRIARDYQLKLASNKELWAAEDQAVAGQERVQETIFAGEISSVEVLTNAMKVASSGYGAIAGAKQQENQQAEIAIEGLTDAQVTAALQSAKANGGFVTLSGVKVPAGMLEDKRQRDQQVALSLEAASLARQAQRLNLAEAMEQRAIKSMSMGQLVAAVQAGGNGLPMTALQTELANRSVTTTAANAVIEARDAGPIRVAQSLKMYADNVGIIAQNYGFVNGNGSITNLRTKEVLGNFRTVTARTQAQLSEHQKKGTLTPQIEAQLLKENKAAYESVIAQFKADVDSQTNDPTARSMRKAFIMNGRVDSETSSQFMFNGISRGLTAQQMGLRGTAAAAYNLGAARFEQLVGKANGLSPEAMKSMPREKRAALFASMTNNTKLSQKELQRQVTQSMAATYAIGASQPVHLNIPALMKREGVDIGVSNQAWQESIVAGEQTVLKGLVKRFGITDDQAQDILAHGEKSRFYTKTMADNGITRGMLANKGAAATLQYLDANYSTGDMIPSQRIATAVRHPAFQNLGAGLQPAFAGKDFGNFVINSFVGDNIATYLDGLSNIYSKEANRRLGQIKGMEPKGVALYGNNPRYRFETVLHAIPDLTDGEIRSLMGATEKVLPRAQMPGLMVKAGALPKPDFSNALQIIGSTKFNDPQLEDLRRRVAKALPKAIATSDRMMAIRASTNPDIFGEEQ